MGFPCWIDKVHQSLMCQDDLRLDASLREPLNFNLGLERGQNEEPEQQSGFHDQGQNRMTGICVPGNAC